MAVYTEVSDEELEEFLSQYDLGGLVTREPSLRSGVPGLRWFVATPGFLRPPRETRPARIFEAGAFRVFVFRAGDGGRPAEVPAS